MNSYKKAAKQHELLQRRLTFGASVIIMKRLYEKSCEGESSLFWTQKRAGDGGNPVPVGSVWKSLRSCRLSFVFLSGVNRRETKVGQDAIPALQGTHMMVCSNRWFRKPFVRSHKAFVLLRDGSFFFFIGKNLLWNEKCSLRSAYI